MWSDGRKSWVKEVNLPTKIKECIRKGHNYKQKYVKVKEFGQERKELKESHSDGNGICEEDVPINISEHVSR
jgi:hypothetical protein